MRNWKGEKREAEIIRGKKKEFNEIRDYLIVLEDSFLDLIFDDELKDSYDEIYSKFLFSYKKGVRYLNEKFNNCFTELNTYFEDNYKPISVRYERSHN